MLPPDAFHALVSGQVRGVGPAVARGVLRACELPYAWAVQYRNRRYDRGSAPVRRLPVPVVSVGNLTLGGTGKTPMVAWLARWFRDRGLQPAIVSRGYGARNGRNNDEACELARELPGVPHLQDPDRFLAGRRAVASHGAQVVILDDGFQHRRLHRDLDLVLLDALQPFGWGHLFPRGTLREPPPGLHRAQAVILSRSSLTTAQHRQATEQQVRQLAPEALWLTGDHRPLELCFADGSRGEVAQLAAKRVIAFCALGNPEGFRRTLAAVGCQPLEFHTFPDHHAFTPRDAARLWDRLRQHKGQLLVCAQKDLVKLEHLGETSPALGALRIAFELHEPQEPWLRLLEQLIAV